MKPVANILVAVWLTMHLSAQVPNTLLHSIPAPLGVQAGAGLGYSVAVDGNYTVVGAPYDELRVQGSGVAKVFDSTTGALLFLLPNPTPADGDFFGYSVAISGTRVVVGAYKDDAGAIDAGSAYVYDLSSGTPTVPVLTLNNPSPEWSDNFGNSVAISGTRIVVGDSPYTAVGSAYVYDLSSGTPTVPVTNLSNPTPIDQYFGYSVAISGTRVVVGSYYHSPRGSAYVYDLSSGTPAVPVATLNNPNYDPRTAMSDRFGWSVGISGTRVVVSTNRTTGARRSYVYDLSSGTPEVPVLTLNNPSPASGDYFAYSVAISGARLVVGAYRDNTGATYAGSAYVYDLSSDTPTVPVLTLNNPSPAAGDNFGISVAISGTRVVVGAYLDDTGAIDAGSAYVYDLSSGSPTLPTATLNNPGPALNDHFGVSVAISGSLLVAGSPRDGTGAIDAGSAYVYDLSSGTPTMPVLTLNNPSPAESDYFGRSVAISGPQVVVGAYLDNAGASSAGSAYVYDLSSGTPTVPVLTLNNPSPAMGDCFGYSVAISGTRLVVGVYADDTGATDAGSAYVYDLSSDTPTVPVMALNNPSPEMGDYFGDSVAISGTQVVVGAYLDDTGASNAGSVYVYDLSSGTPTVPVVTLNNPGPGEGDYFGRSVAISGTRVVVGAYLDDTGAIDAGSSYVYDLSSGTPAVPVLTLNKPSRAMGDYFGCSVAISGTRLVVGAYADDTGATNAGSAYLYDLSSDVPTVPVATLNNPSPAAWEVFGGSVAIDGTSVVSRATDGPVMFNKGSVYVFGPIDGDSDGLRDTWEISHFGTHYGHGPLDDDDHDGIVNLLELAFNLNPTLANGFALPPAVNEGGYLTLTLTKQPGVTYEVQSAGTLLPALPDSFSAASTTLLIDNATTLKVRDTVLMNTPGGRFMRAAVTASP